MKHVAILSLLSIIFLQETFSQEKNDAKNGRAVIELMHARYKKKWYKDLTFTQQTIFYKEGEPVREETWFEALRMPVGLVIKFKDMKSGSGIILKGDSQYVWRENKLVSRTKRVHELFVLGFSVYFDNPAVTIVKLEQVGFDFDKFEIDVTENGKTEFVIGDPAGNRFWIDTESLLFRRVAIKAKNGDRTETQFNRYEKLGKGWIATEVLFLKNNIITMKEVYTDLVLPKTLPANLFMTSQLFSELSW